MDFNKELTEEEIEKVNNACRNVGEYGSVEVVKNGDTIDLIESKRIRIRNGKYHKG